jgi:hypothetical protein
MPERGDDLHTRVNAAYVEDITDRDAFFAAAAEGTESRRSIWFEEALSVVGRG